jgi:hypothetical protein
MRIVLLLAVALPTMAVAQRQPSSLSLLQPTESALTFSADVHVALINQKLEVLELRKSSIGGPLALLSFGLATFAVTAGLASVLAHQVTAVALAVLIGGLVASIPFGLGIAFLIANGLRNSALDEEMKALVEERVRLQGATISF